MVSCYKKTAAYESEIRFDPSTHDHSFCLRKSHFLKKIIHMIGGSELPPIIIVILSTGEIYTKFCVIFKILLKLYC
jgi:hypothetical protein